MKGNTLLITFEEDKKVKNVITQIKTLTTDNGVEYLITLANKKIRLDNIHIIEEQ
jgi:hypothetical protein